MRLGMDLVMNSIERLARSHGYAVKRDRESITRLGRHAWKLNKLVRSDGTPGPVVTVRIVDDRMKWETAK